MKHILLALHGLALSALAVPALACPPPQASEKFEQWSVYSTFQCSNLPGQNTTGKPPKALRFVEYDPGNESVKVSLYCNETTGWSLTVLNSTFPAPKGAASRQRQVVLFYQFDDYPAAKLTGSSYAPGHYFSTFGKTNPLIRPMLQKARVAQRVMKLTLAPDKTPLTIPVAGLDQALERFADICPVDISL